MCMIPIPIFCLILYFVQFISRFPFRVVPRVAVTSFLLVIVIYMLTNVAYFSVLAPQEMFKSDAVAVVGLSYSFF